MLPMGMAENMRKLRAERKPKKISQDELAEASGVSQQLISQIELEKNADTTRLPELAEGFSKLLNRKVLVSEIDPDFAGGDENAISSVPLVDMVSASKLTAVRAVERFDFDEAEQVRLAGLDPKGDWIALRVDGTSMDRISPPDSVILVNLKDTKLVPNACYVIEVDGETTYKRYRPGPDRWEPVSTDQSHETLYPPSRGGPKVVGRVRKTLLDL
jgi:transcriptional regulator with XRE-family HTH domain